ncbi:MAG: hypothetical protein VKO39_05715 [Cyanobacteriota bacterium]|nr:hypothetical protein [Cyanobacteriota bacterium]
MGDYDVSGPCPMAFAAAHPLPFWRGGPATDRNLTVVARVCAEGWRSESERIAGVDKVGCLLRCTASVKPRPSLGWLAHHPEGGRLVDTGRVVLAVE